ncbi:MAG: extracellular solute-binding protein [Christensenellaceae bacterium]|nr:extracellular solute-binding protein [Christensenellaceae bacterium]
MRRKIFIFTLLTVMLSVLIFTAAPVLAEDEEIVLRVCSWEEYIDEGGWDEEELIELENGLEIIGENSMVEDFEAWYFETYGKKVRVEYATFGTNEELYNQLTLGSTFDIVCPSEYMIMKLIAEDMTVPYSEGFFDASVEENYYAKGVSPYIKNVFETHDINGEPWSKYAAGFMWGTTGIVYNSDIVSKEDASTWQVLANDDYFRQVTVKDNVRDSYFAALGMLKHDILMDEAFVSDPDYEANLLKEMNDTDDDTIAAVEQILKDVKDNVYSFETDSGKADMVTGKVVANYQWSGDAVYTMEQAEEDELYLSYAIPKEGSNLWFDGWVMLKSGINGEKDKQHAAEAFVNFLSRPDNVVRNMYYIGYTSVISGGEDETVLDYVKWYYEDEEAEDSVQYDITYFFGENGIITAPAEQLDRELFAQYPTEDVLKRTTIMSYFDVDTYSKINQMWINVRCFDLSRGGVVVVYLVVGALILAAIVSIIAARIRFKVNNSTRQTQKSKY